MLRKKTLKYKLYWSPQFYDYIILNLEWVVQTISIHFFSRIKQHETIRIHKIILIHKEQKQFVKLFQRFCVFVNDFWRRLTISIKQKRKMYVKHRFKLDKQTFKGQRKGVIAIFKAYMFKIYFLYSSKFVSVKQSKKLYFTNAQSLAGIPSTQYNVT